ncbi:MAG: 23S rRNA (pseudouridine(1915)-N(3))-methyltransferase RlmH, partial [Geobacteraceae bacterium]
MKIRVIWPGKTQEEWVRRGIDEYAGRIRRYVQLDLAEAREEKGGSAKIMREREGERLARLVPKSARLILLDERGEEMTSPDFAGVLSRYRDGGISEMVIAIGGAYGVSDALRSRADKVISLSRMTFTHQMVRV